MVYADGTKAPKVPEKETPPPEVVDGDPDPTVDGDPPTDDPVVVPTTNGSGSTEANKGDDNNGVEQSSSAAKYEPEAPSAAAVPVVPAQTQTQAYQDKGEASEELLGKIKADQNEAESSPPPPPPPPILEATVAVAVVEISTKPEQQQPVPEEEQKMPPVVFEDKPALERPLAGIQPPQSKTDDDPMEVELQTDQKEEVIPPASSPTIPASAEPSGEYGSEDVHGEEGHPYVGKRVIIVQGAGKGSESIVRQVRRRGWWALDNHESFVHSKRCRLVDEVSQKDMEEYYAKRGKKFLGRPVAAYLTKSMAKKNKSTQIYNSDNDRKRKPEDYEPIMFHDLLEKNPVESHTLQLGGEPKRRRPARTSLPPILLDRTFSESLHHLPGDHKVTIFNRKTGIIMRDAVPLKDLSSTLKIHSEYEPIIPPAKEKTNDAKRAPYVSRVGRSAFDVRVRETVSPQIREEIASYKDKMVRIKSGRHKGKVGSVETCVPGGWYMVNGILPNMSLTVTHNQIELMAETKERAKTRREEPTLQELPEQSKATQESILTEEDEIKGQFRKVLLETTGSNAKALKQQMDELANEELALKKELNEVVAKGGKTSILKKKLGYILDCRKKVEADWKNSIRTSVVAAAAANKRL